jgi:hypothetical protein
MHTSVAILALLSSALSHLNALASACLRSMISASSSSAARWHLASRATFSILSPSLAAAEALLSLSSSSLSSSQECRASPNLYAAVWLSFLAASRSFFRGSEYSADLQVEGEEEGRVGNEKGIEGCGGESCREHIDDMYNKQRQRERDRKD